MKFCPFCGAQLLSETQKFCTECGSLLSLPKPQSTTDQETVIPAANPAIIEPESDLPSEFPEKSDDPEGAHAQVPAHSISVPEKKAPESEFSEMPEPDETKIETEIPAPIHADTEITDIHSQPLKSESETTAPEPHKDRKKRKRHELKPHTKKTENSSSKGKSKLSFSKKRVPEQTVSPFDIDYDGYYDDVLPRDYNRESEHFIDKDTIKKIVLIFAGACVVIALSSLAMIYL